MFKPMIAFSLALLSGNACAQTTVFSKFFAGDMSAKKIVVWGNSTVAFEAAFFQGLAAQAAPGGVLEGMTVVPEQDNPDKADPGQVSRNQNGHLHALGNIVNMGNNGATLKSLLGKPGGSAPYRIDAICAEKPDLLIIRGPLINDVRQGMCDLACARDLQKTMLERLNACIPGTPILLEIENSLLTTDVGAHGYVKPQTAEAAQAYSQIMRDAGHAFDHAYGNVHVLDLQEQMYGVTAPESSLLMNDQLHPSPAGQAREAEMVIAWLKSVKPAEPTKAK